jgi:hypothetical protein
MDKPTGTIYFTIDCQFPKDETGCKNLHPPNYYRIIVEWSEKKLMSTSTP